MNDELNPSGEDDSTDEVESSGRTAAEVEDFWKKRVSGKDRAHNLELEALRAQHAAELAALQGKTATENERSAQVTDELAKLQAENAALKQERDTALATAKATDLKSRFPASAAELGDDLTTLSEERLTALEAKLAAPQQGQGGRNAEGGYSIVDDPMASFIAENAQPRPFAAQQPTNRPMTVNEIDRELEKHAGEVANW